jgi:hypothetical protein
MFYLLNKPKDDIVALQFVGQEACLRVTNVCFKKYAEVQ